MTGILVLYKIKKEGYLLLEQYKDMQKLKSNPDIFKSPLYGDIASLFLINYITGSLWRTITK